ncbi:hypothetical protein Tco_0845554, partial [Tanacetum coccineum]
MDFILMTSFSLSRKPIEITDREVKRLKRSRIPISQGSMELQERSRVYLGMRRSIPEEIPTSVLKDRAVDSLNSTAGGNFLDKMPRECLKIIESKSKSCGNGAHIGDNCPPKVPIISNLEQCNQTINELPQTLLSVHPTCNYEDENSFTYDSRPNSFNDSPSVLTHPSQTQFETYFCELCGNNAHYGYDCPPRFPLVYEQESCYNKNFNDSYFPQNSQSSFQQYLCCENCGGPHEIFPCQPMYEDYYKQNSCYDPNSFGFDQYQPPQFPVNYSPHKTNREILQAQENLMNAIQAFLKEYDHKPPNEKCMALLLAEERFLKIKQTMRKKHNQPEVIQELLLKLMDDLQSLKGS